MHNAYYTVKPCQNKILQMKWDDKEYQAHTKKVSEALPVIDTRAPKTYMHLHLKLKKIRLEEERLYTIERDNRILLEKMSHIMRTRGRVDNVNDYEHSSMNRLQRQREVLRVTRQNQDIMKRLIQSKPLYDHENWERDWRKNASLMDHISHFPKTSCDKPGSSGEPSRNGVRSSYASLRPIGVRSESKKRSGPNKKSSSATESPGSKREAQETGAVLPGEQEEEKAAVRTKDEDEVEQSKEKQKPHQQESAAAEPEREPREEGTAGTSSSVGAAPTSDSEFTVNEVSEKVDPEHDGQDQAATEDSRAATASMTQMGSVEEQTETVQDSGDGQPQQQETPAAATADNDIE